MLGTDIGEDTEEDIGGDVYGLGQDGDGDRGGITHIIHIILITQTMIHRR